jgi:ABC-type uncharacterized transport system permease subunit
LGLGLLNDAFRLLMGSKTSPDGKPSTPPWRPTAKLLNRMFYNLGLCSLSVQLALLFIMPGMPTKMMVLLGVSLTLLFMTLSSESEKSDFRALQFLAICLAWFLAVGGSYVVRLTISNQSVPLPGFTALHVATATLSSAMSVAALLSSMLYLISFQLLKQKKMVERLRLPSLQTLDNLTEKSLLVGLFFMTISLISGLGLVLDTATVLQVSAFKFVWAFGVWGYYALVIFGRAFWNWRGRKGALLSVWGALLVTMTLFGTLLGTR